MDEKITVLASVSALIAAGAAIATLYKRPNLQIGAATSSRVVVDSCALIDGRIVDLAKLGFLPQTIIVPAFIVAELQLLADGSDSQKRERARYGLEVVRQLQALGTVPVQIGRANPDKPTIDDKLVAVAKSEKAVLFTNDFNLNQVASIEGVTVLNINELAHALRPHVLPGETIAVNIVQVGSNRDQGVGYLDDGTMVVVDGAKRDIGSLIEVVVTRSHQTVAGKMIFAKKKTTEPSRSPKITIVKQVTASVTSPPRKHAPKPQTSALNSKKGPQPRLHRSPATPMPTRKPVQTNRPPRKGYRAQAEDSLLSAIDDANR